MLNKKFKNIFWVGLTQGLENNRKIRRMKIIFIFLYHFLPDGGLSSKILRHAGKNIRMRHTGDTGPDDHGGSEHRPGDTVLYGGAAR